MTTAVAKVCWQITASQRGITGIQIAAKNDNKISNAGRPLTHDKGCCTRIETELNAYLTGALRDFTAVADVNHLSPFTRSVLRLAAAIPYGETRSYSALARDLGRPRAARAVGNALARNPVPILIPCHRVVRRDGTIGPYIWGSAWKKKLLALEKQFAKSVTSRTL